MVMPSTLGTRVRKIIDMSRDKSTLQGTYFNPLFTDRLADKVPDLRKLGYHLVKTETESEQGSLIVGKIVAPNGSELDLGSVLLDGKSVVVQKTLATIDSVVNFIEENAPQNI